MAKEKLRILQNIICLLVTYPHSQGLKNRLKTDAFYAKQASFLSVVMMRFCKYIDLDYY